MCLSIQEQNIRNVFSSRNLDYMGEVKIFGFDWFSPSINAWFVFSNCGEYCYFVSNWLGGLNFEIIRPVVETDWSYISRPNSFGFSHCDFRGCKLTKFQFTHTRFNSCIFDDSEELRCCFIADFAELNNCSFKNSKKIKGNNIEIVYI